MRCIDCHFGLITPDEEILVVERYQMLQFGLMRFTVMSLILECHQTFVLLLSGSTET